MGDALGAPVEFDRWSEIEARFGEAGLRGYVPHTVGWGRSPTIPRWLCSQPRVDPGRKPFRRPWDRGCSRCLAPRLRAVAADASG